MKCTVYYNNNVLNVECEIDNGHLFAQIGNEIVEFKKCGKCKQWHETSNFYANSNTKDGLSSYCKVCSCEYQKELRARKTSKDIQDTPEQVEIIEASHDVNVKDMDTLLNEFKDNVAKYYYEIVKTENNDLYDEIDKLERENKALREKNEQLNKEIMKPKTIADASERELVDYLNTHKVSPRVLINAIVPQAPNLVITITDTISGLTRDIRCEQSIDTAA